MSVSSTKVNSFYCPFCCVFYSLVDGFALWCLMNSHIHTLVATIVDLIVLSSLILSFFFSLIKSSSVLSSTFLCHHLLFHYFKLKPSWLKREATWVAYSTLIFHIRTHVAIVATIVRYCIIISFF